MDAKGYPFEIGIEGGFVQVDEALAGVDGRVQTHLHRQLVSIGK